jgi:transcriptional regulator with XRE-family HTH domain
VAAPGLIFRLAVPSLERSLLDPSASAFSSSRNKKDAKNRVSASMLYEIARSLGVPVSRLFEGLPGNDEDSEPQPLSVDEPIDFIAS